MRPSGGTGTDGAAPLLSLLMIVRDEQHTIGKTLVSVLPHVDRFTILDTGSTDGTADRIAELADAYATPGYVHREAFVDFAFSRNRCIELAAREAVFFLSMDANDELRHGNALVGWCRRFRHRSEAGYHSFLVRVRWNHEQFYMQRLFRSDADCRYVGAVHEYLNTLTPPSEVVEGVHIDHDRQLDEQTSRTRWLRDCAILERQLARRPGDTRTLFYLAQSYVCVGRYADGFACYSARIAAGGADEETFHAHYRRAELAERFLDYPWPRVEAMYLEAHRHSPARAEPLVRIGRHYAGRREFATAYRILRRACDLPVPNDRRMTVDLALYHYGRWDLLGSVAFFVGRYSEGREAIETALRYPGLDPRAREQLMLNLQVYAVRRAR